MATETKPTPPADTEAFKDIRTGTSSVLFFLALVLLGIGLYFTVNARAIAGTPEKVVTTWWAGVTVNTIWPVIVWTFVVGTVSVLGGLLLSSRGKIPVGGSQKPLGMLLVYLLYAFALGMALIPIYLLLLYSLQVAVNPVFIWAMCMAVVLLAGGSYILMALEGDPVRFRLTVMAIGGAIGLLTVLLGFGLPIFTYSTTYAKGLEEWRRNWPALFWPGLASFGGLALMFFSLQLGRGMERESQNVRVLIYGYNTVLTGLLLIAILALPNVLAYAEPFVRFFGRPYDWTKTRINAISAQTRSMLADLKEPITVYALMDRRLMLTQDVKTLLENCQGMSNQFNFKFVYPELANRAEIIGLMDTYSLAEPDGLLVVAGQEGGKTRPPFVFIRSADLMKDLQGGRGQAVSYSFVGESALRNALASLTEGKMTIYFTTGHGEYSLEEAPAIPGRPRNRQPEQLSTLKNRLTARKNVEVKPLPLEDTTKKVPDDASVVVVARPTQPLSPNAVKVLREYVKRNRVTAKSKNKDGTEIEEETVTAGRLVLLLEPVFEKRGGTRTIVNTGLEALLGEYNVNLGQNQIQALNIQPTEGMYAVTKEDSSNPVARAFNRGATDTTVFTFLNSRSVTPLAEKGSKVIDPLMHTYRGRYWVETNFDRDVIAFLDELRSNAVKASEVLSKQPITIAVAVSDPGAGMNAPRDSAHSSLMKDTPRMVVFGTANWITERGIALAGDQNIDLFNSCVSWLREKSTIGTSDVQGVSRQQYTLNIPSTEVSRVIWLPLGLILISIVGVGTGVWVVRRR